MITFKTVFTCVLKSLDSNSIYLYFVYVNHAISTCNVFHVLHKDIQLNINRQIHARFFDILCDLVFGMLEQICHFSFGVIFGWSLHETTGGSVSDIVLLVTLFFVRNSIQLN